MNSANKVTRLLNKVTKRLEEDKQLSAHRVQELINEQTENLKLPIVLTLKKRFEKASKNLEQVNTAALVDGIYSEEKFRFGKFRLTCEQWDYFCRFFPNILISLGLLGTFLGITLNLSSVSAIINENLNQNNNNIDYLLNELGQPLEGMAIAFVSSLIAIACSVILTLVNLGWNTSLAKDKLISSLEDFLDNVLQPTIDGYTRLDKAVNLMVETQNQFLNRFHDNVERVLEKTMGGAADRIAAQNEKSHELAEQVYEGIKLSSTTLAKGSENFLDATSSLKEQVEKVTVQNDKFTSSCQLFEESSRILEKGANIFNSASKIIEQSKFSENLEKITQDLARAEKAFAQTVSNLDDNLRKINAGNKKANELAAKVYNQFKASSEILQESATTFQAASSTIKESQFADRLLEASNKLETIQRDFSQSVSNLQRATASVEGAISLFQRSTDEMVQLGEQQVNSLERQSAQIKELSDNHQQNLNDISSKLEQGADNIAAFSLALQNFDNKNQQSLGEITTQLQQGATNLEAFTQVVEQLNQNNQTSFSTIANKLEQGAENIAEFGLALQDFDNKNQQSLGEITTQLQQGATNLEAFTTVVEQLNQNNQTSFSTIANKLEQEADNIAAFGLALQNFDSNNQQSLREIITVLRVGAQNIEAFKQVVAQLNKNNQQSLGEIKTQLEQGVEDIENLGFSIERFKNNNQKLLGDIATKLQHSNDSQLQTILKQLEEYTNYLRTIQSEVGKLVAILQQKTQTDPIQEEQPDDPLDINPKLRKLL